jgi:hypothetical protein
LIDNCRQLQGYQLRNDNDNNQYIFTVLKPIKRNWIKSRLWNGYNIGENSITVTKKSNSSLQCEWVSLPQNFKVIPIYLLLQVLQIIKITKTSDMVKLVDSGQINIQRKFEEWADLNYSIDNCLIKKMVKLTISVISDNSTTTNYRIHQITRRTIASEVVWMC